MNAPQRFARSWPARVALATALAAGQAAIAAGPAPAAPATPTGTLTFGDRLYGPRGCVHNGSTAACTFVMRNQGQLATLQAQGGYRELNGMQLVDNGNVPHAASNAYFLDKFGSRQAQLVVPKGDGATLIIEFANVDPAVTSGFFSLGNQMVTGIAVATPPPVNLGQPTAQQGQAQAAATLPAVTPAANAGALPGAPVAANGNPVAPGNKVTNAMGKVSGAADTAGQTVTAVAQTANALASMKDSLRSMFGKGQPAAAQPQQPTPVLPAVTPQAPAAPQ